MGLTMDEGEIVAWRKREGDPVSAGEILFEVESDKATLEVESPAAGFVRRILVDEGVTVPVTTVVALIGDRIDEPIDEGVSLSTLGPSGVTPADPAQSPAGPSRPSPTPVATTAAAGGAGHDRAKASPAARKRAQELDIDVASVSGTGPGGRITLEDIEAAAAGRGNARG